MSSSYLVTADGLNNFMFIEAENKEAAIESFLADFDQQFAPDSIEVYQATIDIFKLKGDAV